MSSIFGGRGSSSSSAAAALPASTAASIGPAFTTLLQGGVSAQTPSSVSSPSAPVAPTPAAPPDMPSLFDPAALEAARLQQAKALNSGGRSSTILTTAAQRARGTIAGSSSSKTGSSPGPAALGTN